MKKLLKITGISLLLLLALLFLLPFFFKGQILSLVKSEINQNLAAHVDFKDLDLSFFRRFPRVSVKLENVSVIGQDSFAKDTLLSAPGIDVAVNLLSFFKKDREVYRVDIESPRIHALVNGNGKANWDVAKPSGPTTATDTAGTFSLKLQRYGIHNAYVYYSDETLGAKAEVFGLDHEGKGDFTQDQFTLSTSTQSTGASFSYAGIPYLANSETSIESDIVIDTKKNKYVFDKTTLKVNKLTLTTDGSVQTLSDSSYAMDLRFKAPSTDFKELLSLIPALYKKDFDNLKTSGSASFGGFVKGVYSPSQLPAYDVIANVQNGSFQYPDLPATVKNINLNLHASNRDGAPDNTVLDISKAHIEMNGEPFDFHLLYKNPVSAPYVDGAAKGRIDLSQVAKFIKLEAGTKLAGMVNADAFAKGQLSALQAKQGAFTAGGFL
ncbi:MAG: AsmA family protein, partial [Flaviaesturariibacter sp.]|nr:AsmA family protein [Flaviaesturariibacter sp.]